ncbi:MAG: ornithine decarboxylase [Erysipelotrichaceae bacterium]|nr:MAG: ornithine [Erysipelotrichaceae bacterium]TXT17399.1 MAG: ornithine decarboxylase [Erysipelotrichaceae bacterium]
MIKRIGIEFIEGCGILGADLSIKSLQDMLVFDEILSIDPSLQKDEDPLYLSAVSDFCQIIKSTIKRIISEGHFPLVFGGDHALAIGSVSGSLTKETGVLWIDAHGDCNTELSSISRRIHGMPLATLQGHGHRRLTEINDVVLKSNHILQIGTHLLDQQEAIQMKEWGVRSIMMDEIRTLGLEWMIQEVKQFMDKYPKIHISFDCDSVDPSDAPGVNTPCKNGFTQEEILSILNAITFESVASMDIVEYNPLTDNGKTKAMILTIDALVHHKKGLI